MKQTLHRILTVVPLLAALSLLALPAQAYVGPGAFLSLASAFWALIAAIGAALLFIVLWPIRKMMRRRKLAVSTETDGSADETPKA